VFSCDAAAQATRTTSRRGKDRATRDSRTHATDAVPRGSDNRTQRQQLEGKRPRKGGDRHQRKAQSETRSASRGKRIKRIATPHDALQIRVATTHDALPITIASGALST
jgi:hypothetical protein